MRQPRELLGVIALVGVLCCTPAAADPSISPFFVLAHVSDPTEGKGRDTETDFLGGGAEIAFGSFSVELALGRRALNCAAFKDCPSTVGGYASLKWRPKRWKR